MKCAKVDKTRAKLLFRPEGCAAQGGISGAVDVVAVRFVWIGRQGYAEPGR